MPVDTSFWRDRPTLVTGATGLGGSWVVRRLLDLEADVVCLIRDWVPESEFVQADLIGKTNLVRGDVLDQAVLERVLGEYEVDTVIHLAAQTIVGVANRNPISTFESNIAGTWRLLEACRRSPLVRQILLASPDKAYGDQECVPHTIRSVLRGQPPVIRSDGTSVRDYFYVEDGAAAYLLLAERLATDPSMRGQAFNFSNETPVTVIYLVDRILRIMGSRFTPEIRSDAPNEIPDQFLDATKARTMLGWGGGFPPEAGGRRARPL